MNVSRAPGAPYGSVFGRIIVLGYNFGVTLGSQSEGLGVVLASFWSNLSWLLRGDFSISLSI